MKEMMRLTRQLTWLALILGLCATTLSVQASDASAAPVACTTEGPTSFTVATEAELNDAIACYNSGTAGVGDYAITLAADITSTADFGGLGFTTISQPAAGYSLSLQGNGFALLGADVRVLVPVQTNAGPITIDNLDVPAGPGIDLLGPNVFNVLEIEDSGPLTLTNSYLGGERSVTAINSGLLTIENSRIEGAFGVGVHSGSLTLRNSSVFSYASPRIGGLGASFAEVQGGVGQTGAGNLLIENSSLARLTRDEGRGPTDTAVIQHSTITLADVVGGPVDITSSIILQQFCEQLIDGGANTGCFPRIDQAIETIVRDPADNGCVVPTPGGCVLTGSLPAGSPARGAGDCSTVTTDARGEQRTPAGQGCDSGAYEAGTTARAELCNGKPVTIDMNLNGGIGIGTPGDDVIWGTPGDDTIDAGAGNDTVCSNAGNDEVYGGSDADWIAAGSGDDRVFGGQGHDSIEGQDGNDTIHGNRGNDVLSGGDGNDRIFGYSQDDAIYGGEGDDRLHGNFGDDWISGGPGNDKIFGYANDDQVRGGPGNDTINGNFGDDEIHGGDGDDTLYGADGVDTIEGQDGNDTIHGNSGDDVLLGGQGQDALDGGINTDSCDGGTETDTATRCETLIDVP